MGNHRRLSIIISMEQEKFTFRSYIQTISLIRCFLFCFSENVTWIAFKRLPVSGIHITDNTRYFSLLRAPWKDCKSVQIRIQIHIRFLHTNKTFNCRTVKHAFVIQRFFKLTSGNRHIFQRSKNVGKLKTDKFNILFLYHSNDVSLRVHNSLLFLFCISESSF